MPRIEPSKKLVSRQIDVANSFCASFIWCSPLPVMGMSLPGPVVPLVRA